MGELRLPQRYTSTVISFMSNSGIPQISDVCHTWGAYMYLVYIRTALLFTQALRQTILERNIPRTLAAEATVSKFDIGSD
ncbi:hypothetical protein E2C01_002567 [Portunus trituberculatus]|uniref:Uncharacterized protein n=1 Tax=Portunus trituberculatus TaxID=210409 RepID=A0A5B7CK38_PORTR|nr:hypothetical protein [Portunus trituberculatus]